MPDSARLRRNPADLSEMTPAYKIQEPQKLNWLSTVDDAKTPFLARGAPSSTPLVMESR